MSTVLHPLALDVVKAFNYCLKNDLLPTPQGTELAGVMVQLAQLKETQEQLAAGTATPADRAQARALQSALQTWLARMGARMELP